MTQRLVMKQGRFEMVEIERQKEIVLSGGDGGVPWADGLGDTGHGVDTRYWTLVTR